MSEHEASKVIYEVFQGLKYLAEQSIVHRDFKIANILLAKGVVKIADFGFAKRTKYSSTYAGNDGKTSILEAQST
jgi:serine/threonine protein kinase